MAKLQVMGYAKIPNRYVAIERSRSLSLLEEKLIYMVINMMQKRYEDIKQIAVFDNEYVISGTITFNDFCNTMQIGSVNRKDIAETLKNLTSFTLSIIEEQKDRFLPMFKEFYADYNSNTIGYKLNDVFLQFFTGICKNYFNLSIQEVIGLHSSHAIRLYQLLKAMLNMDKKEFIYNLVEFKKNLSIENKYTVYNNLKRKVIEPAIEQINNSSSSLFCIKYEEIKTGRAVTAIKFIILPKEKNYYEVTNRIPKYKYKQIKNSLSLWLKSNDSTVRLVATKIEHELSYKKPSKAVLRNYIDIIAELTNQKIKI